MDQVDELTCEPDVFSGEKLDAGGRTLCTGTYVITQDDIDAGKVKPQARLVSCRSGQDPDQHLSLPP